MKDAKEESSKQATPPVGHVDLLVSNRLPQGQELIRFAQEFVNEDYSKLGPDAPSFQYQVAEQKRFI